MVVSLIMSLCLGLLQGKEQQLLNGKTILFLCIA